MTHALPALLIQARVPGDPILEHELQCFLGQSDLDPAHLQTLNLPEVSTAQANEALEAAQVVFVGGSGDFSVVTGGFPWHDLLLELMNRVVERKIPTLASCFGFQALVQAFGGELAQDPDRAELGTFPIILTPQGQDDPLFGTLPPQFDAQLGHNDSVIHLPDCLTPLASSQRCPVQAIAHKSAPLWATQFHPELTDRDNITRYLRYIEAYKKPEDSMDQARRHAHRIHRPSPVANALLARFLAHCFGPPPPAS